MWNSYLRFFSFKKTNRKSKLKIHSHSQKQSNSSEINIIKTRIIRLIRIVTLSIRLSCHRTTQYDLTCVIFKIFWFVTNSNRRSPFWKKITQFSAFPFLKITSSIITSVLKDCTPLLSCKQYIAKTSHRSLIRPYAANEASLI